jgi:hypothetical protein
MGSVPLAERLHEGKSVLLIALGAIPDGNQVDM